MGGGGGFCFKQKTAYDIYYGLVGSEMCIRDSPHTSAITTLGAKAPGDPVNIEVDVLAKYVERLLAGDEG